MAWSELDIRKKLIKSGSTEAVVKESFSFAKYKNPSDKEKKSILNFLINSGHHLKASKLLSLWSQQESSFPLSVLASLTPLSYKPPKKLLDSLWALSKSQQERLELLRISRWDSLDPRFKKARMEFQEASHGATAKKLENHWERAEFFFQENLIEEEKKELKIIEELNPFDLKLQKWKKDFSLRWTNHLIKQKPRLTRIQKFKNPKPLNEQELRLVKPLLKEAKAQAKQNPQKAYDLAVMLFSMEAYEAALEILPLAPASVAADWLSVEALLGARHYALALEVIYENCKRYESDPETQFCASYLSAIAFYHLDQKQKAIELLTEILKTRGHYRDSEGLLAQWKNETNQTHSFK